MAYKLSVTEGSGFENANWLVVLTIPAHPGPGRTTWAESFMIVRSFETKDEAEQERFTIARNLITQIQEDREKASSERR